MSVHVTVDEAEEKQRAALTKKFQMDASEIEEIWGEVEAQDAAEAKAQADEAEAKAREEANAAAEAKAKVEEEESAGKCCEIHFMVWFKNRTILLKCLHFYLAEAEIKQRSLLASRLELQTAERERMARVHPVYLDWCRIFSKEPNDSRFATFASNYIKMEAFAIKTGDRMQFNEWYDCTETEYNRIFREKENANAREEKAEAESVAKAAEEARLAAETVANAAEEARLAAEALNLENEARQRLAEKEAKEGAERAARIAAEESGSKAQRHCR